MIIAEVGQAHDGSLGIAHSYIDALAKTGVNAVKFQTHIAHAESSPYEDFRINFSYEDKTRYEYWKRMEFSKDQWLGLKRHCEDLGMEFISSPFSMEAVDLLNELNVKKFKIGSGEMQNLLMLKKIAMTGKPILLSTGMSSLDEIESTLSFLRPYGNEIVLFQCTSEYPTTPNTWGLNNIAIFNERFGLPLGFSDHSGDIFACLAATALGVQYVEFHVVFDKYMFGPDSLSSLTIDQTKLLVSGINQIKSSLMCGFDKNNVSTFNNNRVMFGKSLAARIDIPRGVRLTEDLLETKKPGNKGVPSSEFREVLGKIVKNDLKAGEFISLKDIENG